MRFIFSFALLLSGLTLCAQQPLLLNAHSHNDYTRKRPLFDALDNGFFSIEVDIFFEDGLFVVAHTRAGIRKSNTLEKLYLQPLLKRVAENDGRVYRHGPPEFQLMLDLKSEWGRTQLDTLQNLVKRYGQLFTYFENGVKYPGAVRIVLSGSGATHLTAEDNPRYFSVDGGFGDINSPFDASLVCRVSEKYSAHFTWSGRGTMPENEKNKLRLLVAKAHESGRQIRFWALPHRKKLWREWIVSGVDWINIDKLEKFRNFVLNESPVSPGTQVE